MGPPQASIVPPFRPNAAGIGPQYSSKAGRTLGFGPICMTTKTDAWLDAGSAAMILRNGANAPADPAMTMMALTMQLDD